MRRQIQPSHRDAAWEFIETLNVILAVTAGKTPFEFGVEIIMNEDRPDSAVARVLSETRRANGDRKARTARGKIQVIDVLSSGKHALRINERSLSNGASHD